MMKLTWCTCGCGERKRAPLPIKAQRLRRRAQIALHLASRKAALAEFQRRMGIDPAQPNSDGYAIVHITRRLATGEPDQHQPKETLQ